MTAHPHPTPGALPSPTAPPARGHMPHASPVTPSLHPIRHPARSITQPEVTTPVTVSPPDRDITTPRSPRPDPRRCFTRHAAPASHPRQTTPAGPPNALSPPFFHPRKRPEKGIAFRPSKKGQNQAEKTTAKICDTLHVCFSLELLAIHPLTGPRLCRLHKFVTPLRYKIPPFSLAQPRAKICDTPQIRNTPIFPGTALAANGAHFKRAKKAKISPKSARRAKPRKKVPCKPRKNL